jgi:hypothetical protein
MELFVQIAIVIADVPILPAEERLASIALCTSDHLPSGRTCKSLQDHLTIQTPN